LAGIFTPWRYCAQKQGLLLPCLLDSALGARQWILVMILFEGVEHTAYKESKSFCFSICIIGTTMLGGAARRAE